MLYFSSIFFIKKHTSIQDNLYLCHKLSITSYKEVVYFYCHLKFANINS